MYHIFNLSCQRLTDQADSHDDDQYKVHSAALSRQEGAANHVIHRAQTRVPLRSSHLAPETRRTYGELSEISILLVDLIIS